MPAFQAAYEVDRPIDQVFEWHLDTRNAAAISPPWLRVVSVEGTFPLSEGSEVRLVVRQRHNPLPQRWRVRVAHIRRPTLIVDDALSSPFARWHHQHCFRDLGGGRTRVTDRVDYALPLRLDRLAGRLVRRQLARTFAHRHRASRALLESRPDPGFRGIPAA